MPLINCPECGKEISNKAANCPNCGCPSAEWAKVEKAGEYSNGSKTLHQNEEPNAKSLPVSNTFNATATASNDSRKKEGRVEPGTSEKKAEQKKEKKKDSVLSIWACVLALFTVTIPAAFILALVDLSINDKERKHGGSWFAIIFSVSVVVITFLLKFL